MPSLPSERADSDRTDEAGLDAVLARIAPLDETTSEDDVARVWTQVRARTVDDPSRVPAPAPTRHHVHRVPRSKAISIGIAVAALGFVAWFARGPIARYESTGTYTYRTAAGQRQTVQLPDGSHVTLAPATTLTLAAGVVTVDGQAYFTITPHHARPVLVQTTHALVRVLGTKFVVRHYSGESRSRVVVEDGRVTVQVTHGNLKGAHAGGQRAVLSAQMLAEVSDSAIGVTAGIVIGDYTGWTQGQLVFEQTPMNDVVRELSRAYGADIRLADSSFAKERISLTASSSTQPITDVLDLLAIVIKAHVVRDSNTFLLVPGRVSRSIVHPRQLPSPETQYGR